MNRQNVIVVIAPTLETKMKSNIIHKFRKSAVSANFLNDCRKDCYYISESKKQITMEIPLSPSNRFSKKTIVKNYYPNVEF